VNRVIRQRAFAGPALLLHPLAEANEQRRKRNDPMVRLVGNEARISEVAQEEASAAENLQPKRVTEWTTSVCGARSSSPNMTIKASENRIDRSVEGYADAARPVGQMLSRSEMSASGELRVPVPTQLVCEARYE
jgi:hypothetical protein